ncbi:MAG: twin-arginine translocase TatA/TatE family subunit [Moraxella sp.]|nr:twin-arginine translocase TatA/TatE family subunit [Moraxella sp.]
MFGLGFFEIFLFGTIALIVLGPDKLVLAMRQLGKWYALFLHNKDRLQREVGAELDLVALQRQLKDDVQAELAKLRATEAALKAELNTLKKEADFTKDALTKNTADGSDTLEPRAADRRGLLGLDTVSDAASDTVLTQDTPKEDPSTGELLTNDTAPKNAWQAIAAFGHSATHTADTDTEKNTENTAPTLAFNQPETKPMNGRFFLLGDYDKRRRLPPPPFLANTKADTLLYDTPEFYP